MIRALCLLAIMLGLCCATTASAFLGDSIFLPPHDGYQEFTTAHFKLIYPERYRAEAEEAAVVLEDVNAIETKAFNYQPDHRCTIILTDNQDYANGVTSAVGLQGIVLYLTAPDPYSSIGEYDHWLKNLITHEYSHYVTLEQARGVFEFGRILFGNLIFPNHLWPTSIAEGMAVYAESTFTRQGRGHGTYYTTLTRDGLFHGTIGSKFLDFDQLSGPLPDYPFGEAAYFAGWAMVDEMMQTLGKDAPARFAEESSWRLPYLNNGTLENISPNKNHEGANVSFQKLWAGYLERSRKKMVPEFDWLRAHGKPDPEFYSEPGLETLGARLSPDQTKLAYAATSGHEKPAIFLVDLASRQTRKLDDAVTGAQLAFSDDGKTLYYAKTDFVGPYRFYDDLYAYDLEHGSVSRLTHGERSKDPGFCATHGQHAVLVYSTQVGRLSQIKKFDLVTGRISVVYEAEPDHHVSNPRCATGSDSVVFAEHGTRPFEDMREVKLSGGAARVLFGGLAAGYAALFPEPLPNGDIYFTRVISDYYDLAVWNARTRTVKLLARSSGGYWLPSVGPSKVAVSYISSTGLRAGVMDRHTLEAEPISAVLKAENEEEHPAPGGPVTSFEQVVQKRSGYNLLESLQPRIWSPYLLVGTQSQYGGIVLGWDDTDQLEYTMFGWYDTISRKPEGIFSTYHRVGSFKVSPSIYSQVSDYATDGIGGREYDEERKLLVTISRPFPGTFQTLTPAVIGEWARVTRDGNYGKSLFSPDQRLGLDFSYDSRRRYLYSIANETGTYFDITGRRLFSGANHAWKGLVNLQQLLPVWPRHASLSFNGFYGIAPQPIDAIPVSALRVGGPAGTLSDLDPPLRGYPLGNFVTRRAAILQSEFHVPVAQIFRAPGTFPVFLENVGLYAFFDAAILQRTDNSYTHLVDSTGGGVLLNTDLGYTFPFKMRVEFAHGLQTNLNGENTVSAALTY